jgi:hypothetical protein
VDDLGPRLRHLTKPAQLDRQRFQLEWVLPLEPGLSTHVTLFDMECFPPHALAAGEGGDEAEALLDLWTTLRDCNELSGRDLRRGRSVLKRTGGLPEQLEKRSPSQAP